VHVVQVDVVSAQPLKRLSQLLANEGFLATDLQGGAEAELGGDDELGPAVDLEGLADELLVLVGARAIRLRRLCMCMVLCISNLSFVQKVGRFSALLPGRSTRCPGS